MKLAVRLEVSPALCRYIVWLIVVIFLRDDQGGALGPRLPRDQTGA